MNTNPYASASFEEFWPHYVRLHTRGVTQAFHAAATLSWPIVVTLAIFFHAPLLVCVAPFLDYAVAQTSHRFFEKNTTTPTKNPLWHTRAELRMLRLVLTLRMAREVQRCAA